MNSSRFHFFGSSLNQFLGKKFLKLICRCLRPQSSHQVFYPCNEQIVRSSFISKELSSPSLPWKIPLFAKCPKLQTKTIYLPLQTHISTCMLNVFICKPPKREFTPRSLFCRSGNKAQPCSLSALFGPPSLSLPFLILHHLSVCVMQRWRKTLEKLKHIAMGIWHLTKEIIGMRLWYFLETNTSFTVETNLSNKL